MLDLAISLYSEMLVNALPVAIAIEIGNLIVCTFMRVAFGGKLWFGR